MYLKIDGDGSRTSPSGIGLRDLEGVGVADDRGVKGKTVAEAEALFERFHDLVTSPPDEPVSTNGLGKLAVFAGVREYPVAGEVRQPRVAHDEERRRGRRTSRRRRRRRLMPKLKLGPTNDR